MFISIIRPVVHHRTRVWFAEYNNYIVVTNNAYKHWLTLSEQHFVHKIYAFESIYFIYHVQACNVFASKACGLFFYFHNKGNSCLPSCDIGICDVFRNSINVV